MENLTNQQQHEAAMKQKELDSQQLIEYINFNTMSKSSMLEEELLSILEREDLSEDVRRDIARCVQIARGYTEYKVLSIAEATGFNRTRTKTLIQYLISENKLELVSLENTTFLKLV